MKKENLLKYQEIDGQLKKLVTEINQSEESVKGKKLGVFLKESEEKIKKMDKRADELNSLIQKLKANYQQSNEKFAELEEGVEQAIDKDELNYVAKKLAELTKTIAGIEKELANAIKEMGDIAKRYDDLRAKVPSAKAQYKECREKFEQRKKDSEPQIAALKQQLAELEKDVDQKVFAEYQKLRGQNIYPVIVPLEGNNCGGCRMDLSIGEIGKIESQGYVVCENCHRIIYKG